MDWQNITSQLAPLQKRWDTAVLANLPEDGTWTRPGDLLDAINSQAGQGRQISWKVLEDTLRRLEADSYIAREEIPRRVPRETRCWLLARGRRLIAALTLLEAWLDQDAPGGTLCTRPGWHASPTRRDHGTRPSSPKTA
jgi:DNA-binding HxlR family transcriptional regulator